MRPTRRQCHGHPESQKRLRRGDESQSEAIAKRCGGSESTVEYFLTAVFKGVGTTGYSAIFLITLYLRPPCSTYGTSTTQWTGSISVAFLRYRRTLPLDIEFPQKPALWILAVPKPRSVLVSSTVAFCHLGILLAVSGECIRRCYIEHLTSHHVCSFGPTATSGH